MEAANYLATVYDPGLSTRTQLIGDGADDDVALRRVPDVVELMTTFKFDPTFIDFEVKYVLPKILTPNGRYDMVVLYIPSTDELVYCWGVYIGLAKPINEDTWVIPVTTGEKPFRPPRD